MIGIDVFIDPADKGKGELVSSIRIHWRAPRAEHFVRLKTWKLGDAPIPVEPWEYRSAIFSFTPFDTHEGRSLFNIAVERIERLKSLIVDYGLEPKVAFTRMVAEYDIEQRLAACPDGD